ncbi:MAG: GNAT family N-acetyltransferase [bacterium]|nr:GNAT family N-acetyltransferase [bacterium]
MKRHPTNEMEIRKATLEDFPGIRKLIREYPDKLIQVHLPKPSEFFVAIENGKIIGCCALEIYSKRLAEIRSLAVTKESQNRGIATKLVSACMAAARKKKIYELLAIVESEKFLAKFGFHTFNKEKLALINILGN